MRNQVLMAAMTLIVAGQAMAKNEMLPLAAQDAQALQGKTIAQTAHEPPSLVAMTAGKAAFGLFGAAAMSAAGNAWVKEKQIPDPALGIREQLGALISQTYGAQMLPLDATPTKAKKPAELAKLHPEADYVLDVRSAGWNYAYYATQWGNYWVGYSVQVRLVDTHSGRLVSNVACNSHTMNEKDPPPTLDMLQADDARLFKHITAALGARCVQVLAKEQFLLADAQVPPLPAALANVLRMDDAITAPAEPAVGSDVAPEQAPVALPALQEPAAPVADAPAETAATGIH